MIVARTHSRTRARAHPHTLALPSSRTLTRSHPHTLSHSHSPTLSRSRSRAHSRSLTLARSLSRTRPLAHSRTLTHPQSLTLTLSHSRTRSCLGAGAPRRSTEQKFSPSLTKGKCRYSPGQKSLLPPAAPRRSAGRTPAQSEETANRACVRCRAHLRSRAYSRQNFIKISQKNRKFNRKTRMKNEISFSFRQNLDDFLLKF